VQGWKVDATDLAACLKVARAAVASARSGGGPQLIVGTLLRLVGHGEHDDSSYIPDEVKFSKVGQDCLLVAEKFMIAEGWATKAEITSWLKEARLTVDQAVSQVSKEPIPIPIANHGRPCLPANSWKAGNYERHIPGSHPRSQFEALRSNPNVFIYGQDIGQFGGAFKATKGLAREFPGRVLDAPISEDAMVGMAVGAAIGGARPIVEMQFADFSSVGFNQIVNQAATLYWRTNTPCPITIRLPSGGTAGSGPFHSQSMESIYAHYPGLVILTPATVEMPTGCCWTV
jgi:hypothetical protein